MTDQASSTQVEATQPEDKKKKTPPTPDELKAKLLEKELNAKIVYNKEILILKLNSLTTGREVSLERLKKLELLNTFIETELDKKVKEAPSVVSEIPASK